MIQDTQLKEESMKNTINCRSDTFYLIERI